MRKGSRSTSCPSKEERGLWGLSRSTTLDFELQKEWKREGPWEAVPMAGAPWVGVQVAPVPRSLLERCAAALWLPFCPWRMAMSTCRRLLSPIWQMPSVGSWQSWFKVSDKHWCPSKVNGTGSSPTESTLRENERKATWKSGQTLKPSVCVSSPLKWDTTLGSKKWRGVSVHSGNSRWNHLNIYSERVMGKKQWEVKTLQ